MKIGDIFQNNWWIDQSQSIKSSVLFHQLEIIATKVTSKEFPKHLSCKRLLILEMNLKIWE